MATLLDLLQWPAMLLTVIAVWLAGYQHKSARKAGFWIFLISNGLWAVWGVHAGAWALVVLQFVLAGLNIRGPEFVCRGGGHPLMCT